MKVTAKLNKLRISPQKVRLAANILKGLDVANAQAQAENLIKRSSLPLHKLIQSAIANAENNFGLDRDNLYVYDIQVGEGNKLRRWMPRAFGRASMIIKRSSHITLTLEERIEGKNRKTKEQLEKERKERAAAKKKLEEAAAKEEKAANEEKAAKEEKGEQTPEAKFKKESKEEIEKRKGGKQDGWVKKMFRRKSV